MGALLAAMVYVAFFYQPIDNTALVDIGRPLEAATIVTPDLDEDVLAAVEDDTPEARQRLDTRAVEHLLQKSLDIGPTVAAALGMTDEPVPTEVVQSSTDSFRGRYLFYEGTLAMLDRVERSHPIEGFDILEGAIDTPQGERILFYVSDEANSVLREGVGETPTFVVGDFVRVEGYFLKLADRSVQPVADAAPVLVGPRLLPTLRRWDPVKDLDLGILDSIEDGEFDGQQMLQFGDVKKGLWESQGEPLWHMASYANYRAARGETLAEWRSVPALNSKEQLDGYLRGRAERGEPIRLLGTYVTAKWSEAGPNPIGAEQWTEVWVQVRDLGAKLVPVWIPKKVEGFRYNDGLEVRAFYLRNYSYETFAKERSASGRMRRVKREPVTPVFIAADLNRYVPDPKHPALEWLQIGLMIAFCLLLLVLFMNARKERVASRRHAETLAERRRKRRNQIKSPDTPDSPGAPSTP